MNELKKCPFCGGEAELQCAIDTRIHHRVHCSNMDCPANCINLWEMTEERAINAWNNRKPAEEVVARLEECSKSHFNYWDEFDDEYSFGSMNAYMNAIAIVKEGMG